MGGCLRNVQSISLLTSGPSVPSHLQHGLTSHMVLNSKIVLTPFNSRFLELCSCKSLFAFYLATAPVYRYTCFPWSIQLYFYYSVITSTVGQMSISNMCCRFFALFGIRLHIYATKLFWQ